VVDEPRYQALITACDSLLLAPDSLPDRIAVPWLHVQNEHPSILSRYQDLFQPPPRPAALRSHFRRSAGIAKTLAQSPFRRDADAIPRSPDLRFPAKVDVLFISHLVSANVRSDTPDFYYGSLPEQLAAHGISSLVALQNEVVGDEDVLRARLNRGGVTSRVVLPRLASLPDEGRMLSRARRAASELRAAAASAGNSFDRAVALEAARYAGTAWTIHTLRLHGAVKRLCARFRPRALIVLWEGRSWERMTFHAARTVDPSVRCIGYQHAMLFPRTHALKRSLGASYDPDVILTIGHATADILKKCQGLRTIPVLIYGSHRRLLAVSQRATDASTRCLVIPDGIESECLTLFDFAVNAAARHPDLQLVLRTHPVLPFQQLARRYARFRTLPANVRVSDSADIANDFNRCDWALYRGSSAAVHAVLAGTRPIYLERPGELRIDPLFALHGWRRHVATLETFSAVVAGDRATALEDRRREWEPARDFCDRYAVAPDPDVVRRLLT
jgi:hypothetical protein